MFGSLGGTGFAGENEDAERAGATGHGYVGIKAISDHGQIGRLQ